MSIEGKGSFRGAPFITTTHKITTGRRQPTYSVAYSEGGALSNDMGRAPRRYQITCFVAGPDYRAQAYALQDALETRGPGVLIHPEHGRVLVTIADDVGIDEDTNQLGVVRFSFLATEAADDSPKQPSPSAATAVARSAQVTKDVAVTVLADPRRGVPTPPIADWVRAAHLDVIGDVLAQARLANGTVSALTSIPTGIASEIDLLSQETAALIATPARLASSLLGMFERVAGAITRVGNAVDNFGGQVRPLVDVGYPSGSLTTTVRQFATLGEAPPVPGDTPARREQRQGQVAIQTTTRAMGLASLATVALELRYDSARDARAVRDALSRALRDLASSEPEPDNELADSLRDLAAKVTVHLSAVAGTLRDLTVYETQATLPVEVIAHRLYGDTERADEIVRMNKLPNPGVVPAFTRLEVWRT